MIVFAMKEDWEKALLFLYVASEPMSRAEQIGALSCLCSWDNTRSIQAFEEAEKRGMSQVKPDKPSSN